ncbi:HEAT repeat domain-containing protein [uncultured Lacinutrix sp.]|uniref:HEAT repeat domain-containing protein n=1 Tax=uncultured Lacinutrix sp. TaxID=574032 RepID=UPI002636448D|nr:HEAT repeat domain-containing protein [uncultured Lacinutrix sp.]
MFHQITYLLFKANLIQPSEKDILFWMENNELNKIEYALEHGNYKTRKLAAEAIEKIGKPSSIPILLKSINDNVKNVSIAALNALEKIGSNDELINTIIKKRFNWAKHICDNKKRNEANKGKKIKIYRWERTSKKSFERVKEQLKRSMR